jgi:hypothetical protein
MIECPRCRSQVKELQSIDDGLRSRLAQGGVQETVPAEVCMNCFVTLRGMTSKSGLLLAQQKAKEENRMLLWKSRVILIKKARNYMNAKMFAEAAVAYEKYLRALEIVFDAKPGELRPEQFKDSARTKELTVVASAYWDLMRIYDTSDKYIDRQKQAANQLASFIRFTPVYPDILKKAQAFVRSARNPAVIKQFIKASHSSRPRCFIATAAFNGAEAPEVQYLSSYRDDILLDSHCGRAFVAVYYQLSPPIAKMLDRHPELKPPVQKVLRHIIDRLQNRNQAKDATQD